MPDPRLKRLSVTAGPTVAGAVTVYSDYFSGKISQIRYVKDLTTPFTDGVDFAVTVEGTGEGIWTEANVNADATRAPRQATHGVDGVASLYAAAGLPVQDKIVVAQDRLVFAITSAGNTKTGVFYILIEDYLGK